MTPLQPPELGALLDRTGNCVFRVWAPNAKGLHLRLIGEPDRLIAMQPESCGYYTAAIGNVRPGQRYMYEFGGGTARPDPASRSQPDGVHGPSAVVDRKFSWSDAAWQAPEMADSVIYELHVGTFTSAGTFDAAIGELGRLKEIGITTVEIMPVAQFPGPRNWGYDGVYPFAVQHSYGGAIGLKRFVDACHAKGLAVVLDVVYNHLGPEGNYLRDFGPYFTSQYKTPWGEALNFDGPGSDRVREYFHANALMWLSEYHIDALRLDAVHAIRDFSAYPFLAELADLVQARSADLGRRFALIAESDLNDARLVQAKAAGGYGLDGMWSDDLHHALHTLLTGERDGYYEDFGRFDHLVRAYRDGFTYGGEYSVHRGRRHGNSPAGLAPRQFVVCSQNHDQIGNRAHGERLTALTDFEGLKLAAGVVLLSPYVPLLFMGEEYAEPAPFLYFVSHGDPALVDAVRRGRREEFRKFAWQQEPPDPQAETTFARSRLDTAQAARGRGAVLQRFYTKLLELRRRVAALGCREGYPARISADEERRLLWCQRLSGTDEVLIAFHFGAGPAEFRAAWPPGRWRRLLDSAATTWSGSGSAMPEDMASDGNVVVKLPPRSLVVYAQAR